MSDNNQFTSFFFLGLWAAFPQLTSSFLGNSPSSAQQSILGHFFFSVYILLSLGERSILSCNLKYNAYVSGFQICLQLWLPHYTRTYRSSCLIATAARMTSRYCKLTAAGMHSTPTPSSVFLNKSHHHPPNYSGQNPRLSLIPLFGSLWSILTQNIIQNQPLLNCTATIPIQATTISPLHNGESLIISPGKSQAILCTSINKIISCLWKALQWLSITGKNSIQIHFPSPVRYGSSYLSTLIFHLCSLCVSHSGLLSVPGTCQHFCTYSFLCLQHSSPSSHAAVS